MTTKKMRKYELYTDGFTITNLTKNYKNGMLIVHLKAVSIKQAYYLTARRVTATNNNPGITSVDNSRGPRWTKFIFDDCLWPDWWDKNLLQKMKDFDINTTGISTC